MKPKLKIKDDYDDFDPDEALIIDKKNLDEENRFQAKLMAKYSRIFGRKVKERYNAELELDIIKDQLGDDVKENPKKWNLKKGERITEALISRVIVRSERYQQAHKRYAKAYSEYKEWEGLLKACEQRAWSLKSLENLWEKNYY